MLSELPLSNLGAYTGRFTEPPAHLAAASIAAGNTVGRLWVGSASVNPSLVLWDQGNNILYVGAPNGDPEVGRLVDGAIRNAAAGAGLDHFGVRALDAATERDVARLFGALLLGERRMQFWECPLGHMPAVDGSMDGVACVPIDAELLARDDVAGLDEVRQEIAWMWPSVERYHQHGLGVAALHERRLICWCTAEYVSSERCGIGIATAEDFRGRGIATATAAEFVRYAAGRGLTPCWECGADNAASARVAAKLGFELRAEHRTWLGRFPAGG